ncbi:MAG: hypothetical protein R3Y13_00295 [bacterium]
MKKYNIITILLLLIFPLSVECEQIDINDLIEGVDPGSELYIIPGDYFITESVVIDKNITLTTDGEVNIYIDKDGINGLTIKSGLEYVSINNINIINIEKATKDSFGLLVGEKNSTNNILEVNINNTKIEGFGAGIVVYNTDEFSITNSYIDALTVDPSHAALGLQLTNVKTGQIRNNNITVLIDETYNKNTAGILLQTKTSALIEHNSISAFTGISVYNQNAKKDGETSKITNESTVVSENTFGNDIVAKVVNFMPTTSTHYITDKAYCQYLEDDIVYQVTDSSVIYNESKIPEVFNKLKAEEEVVFCASENQYTITENIEVLENSKITIEKNAYVIINEDIVVTLKGTLQNEGVINNNGFINNTGSILGTGTYSSLANIDVNEKNAPNEITEITVTYQKNDSMIDNFKSTIASDYTLLNNIINSKNIDINISILNIEEQKIDENYLKEIYDKYDDLYISTHFDISINAEFTNETVYLANLDEKIKFNIYIPDTEEYNEEAYEREYYIISYHDETIEKIKLEYEKDGSLSFSTNEFSIFTLAYTEDLILSSPTTGDNILIFISLTGVSLIAIVWILKINQKEKSE